MLPILIAGACGVPVVPVVIKDHSQPFPCQDCPCPCADAESCWRSCCCMSDRQKLSWAERHGATPPAWFLEQQIAKFSPDGDDRSIPACCGNRPRKPTEAPAAQPEPRVGVVLLSAQDRCLGTSSGLALLPAALPCRPGVPLLPIELLGSWAPPCDIRRDAVRLQPPAPPPRHRIVAFLSPA
jgi:hypothetical protein